MADVTPLSLKALVSTYEKISRRGRYAAGEQDTLAKACQDVLSNLPAHRRIVAFALCELFIVGAKTFDRTAQGTISWAQLDTATREAVRFVTIGADPADAIRITDTINMYRLDWFGE